MGNYWWLILLAVPLGLMALPYLLGPVLIYFLQRFNVPTEVVAIDPRQDALPTSVREPFAQAYDVLKSLGFELRGVVILPKLVPNCQAICAVYVNDATAESANTSYIVSGSGPFGDLTVRYAEFVTRLRDGTMVQTNNCSQISAFRPREKEHTLQFWDVYDLKRLRELHTAHTAKHALSPPMNRLDEEFLGDVVQCIHKAAVEEVFAAQVPTGLLTPTTGGYRPTLIGAVVLTWQELWPISAWRKMRRKRASERFLHELALSQPSLAVQ